MSSKRRIRLIAETYSAPSLNATPMGEVSPTARVLTSRLPADSVMAYTLPSDEEPENTVPFFPSASSRALGTSAHSSIEKPGGNLIFSSDSARSSAAAAGNAKKNRQVVMKWATVFILDIAFTL